ncbi:SbcC/MukB-like Walker B domain-containing protein [Thioalkalivibrio thiocyanodenitrificans]|uniref:SbcC/MukB-like Walker B domain-containing protein n=1 Tax=Thioalkalivibrio thiocyanodenitrificans TaxID=243063 RepID=UPI00037C88C3|nr:SbcC/MukB-like Walker B domain-containing protein [Thioalkalivibrio thiocyanodenitrificans]
MKALTRIVLVNWYLFEAVEWEIRGHAALLGKNGAGKSSLIDAIQLVMLGGNLADWRSNAKATDRRGARDVRSYVLGLVKDEDAVAGSAFYQPRPDALSRIVLVFTDEETGEKVSVGAAISARKSDPQAQFEGFFIAEGHELRLSDLLDTTDLGEIPKPYPALKAMLGHHLADTRVHFYPHAPTEMVKQLLSSLGTASRIPLDSKFRRAFKQTVSLSGLDESVSDFVRTSILDSKTLNLEQMRESIASYRRKQEAVQRTKEQIERLNEIDALLTRAQRSGQRRAGYAWCAAEYRFQMADSQREQLTESLVETAGQYSALRAERRALAAQRQRLETELMAVRGALANDDAKTRKTLLEQRLQAVRGKIERAQEALSRARDRLAHVSEVLEYKDRLDASDIALLSELNRVCAQISPDWPEDAAAVDRATKAVRGAIGRMIEETAEKHARQGYQGERIRERIAELEGRRKRLEGGASDLSRNTLVLQEALEEAGIRAVPVCELVEVSDPQWQPAIEAYLRSNMEALIVPAEQATEATEIYRRLKKGDVYGATVVNTLKVSGWRDRVEPGTAGALIEGSDPLAVAYVRRLLHDIALRDVDTRALMNEKRALTKDGMFVREAGIQRLRLPSVPTLGKGAAEEQIKQITREAERLGAELTSQNEEHRALGALAGALSGFNHQLNELTDTVASRVKALGGARDETRSLEKMIEAIDTSHLEQLEAQEKALEGKWHEVDALLSKGTQRIGELRATFRNTNKQRRQLARQLPDLAQARRECEQDEDYDATRTNEMLADLDETISEEGPDGYQDLIAKATERSKSAEKLQKRDADDGREKLAEYRVTYETRHFMDAVSEAGRRAEVQDLVRELREVGLHERAEELDEALRRVQRVLRSDIAIKLQTQIKEMERRFTELNSELRRRPFSSNQIYQFRYERKPEFKEFLSFIDNVDEHVVADIDGLFDVHAGINEKIEQMLAEDAGDEFADYRQYFTFDIEIQDPETGIKERLSKRIGSASGGEHKTPFYVAMGASMASAYRIEPRPGNGGFDGGLNLYLADEAFEKMDSINTAQAADYLKSIGLQLFVAAPDNAEARLRCVVDTVLFFIRDGDKAWVEPDYVTAGAQRLLKQAFLQDEAVAQDG